MAAGGIGPRAFTASCFLLCSLLPGLQEGKRLPFGLPVALGECHGVVVWYYDVDMAADEDLDEEETDLSRTEGPDLSPP